MRDRLGKEDLAIRAVIQDAFAPGPSDGLEHPAAESLAAFLNGALVQPERASVEKHLAVCGACTEVLLLASRMDAEPSSRMTHSRVWRAAASWLLVGGALVAAFFAGGMAGTKVESLAMIRIGQMLGGRVSADSVHLVFEGVPTLKIHDFQLRLHGDPSPTIRSLQATLRPVFSGLSGGDLQASVTLTESVITIVETASGQYSIDPVLPGARPPKALRDVAWRNGITDVDLQGATIRYIQKAAGESFLLQGVDAQIESLRGPGPVRVRAVGSSGPGQAPFRLEGEVSFGKGGQPVYAFRQVEIASVPTRMLGVPEQVLRGRLSFSGQLAGFGSTLHALLASIQGAGDARIGAGSLPNFSLIPNVVASLLPPSVKINPTSLLEPPTVFESLEADIRLEDGILFGRNILMRGPSFEWEGSGKVLRNLELVASGQIVFDERMSGYLSNKIPAAKGWRTSTQKMVVPLRASGILPKITLELNGEPPADEPGAAPIAFVPAENGLHEAVRHARRGFGSVHPLPAGLEALSSDRASGGSTQPQQIGEALGTSQTSDVFLTGYYEPIIEGRRDRSAKFRFPIYGPPADLEMRAQSRSEIEAGALQEQGLELFWTDDPVGLFFLQIQGSGRLRLADNTLVRLGYAAHNSHTYRSVGRVLVERGDLTLAAASAPGIRSWLTAHPAKVQEVLQTNPRYIYFREVALESALGPLGSLGVPLVPWHSIAADPDVHAKGSVGRLRTVLPDGRALDTIVIAMDSGAAIQGPERIDLFVGQGPTMGDLAGRMRSRATIDWLGH